MAITLPDPPDGIQWEPIGPRKLYPWDEWFDGHIHIITQGPKPDGDYQITTQNMVATLHTTAQRRNMRVVTRQDLLNDRVMFMAFDNTKSMPGQRPKLPDFPPNP